MKRKFYRSSATLLMGSFFLFSLGGCSSALNSSSWAPFWGQEDGYFAAKKAKQDIQAFYRLACVYQEKNQHQMALEQFKRVLQLDPNHVQSYNGMGISYDRLGNSSRALGCYTAALKINPDLDYVHNNMGYSYLLRGEAAPAAAAFRKAIALNKTNDRYRNNLGVAYAQMGKVHQALAEFKSNETEAVASAPEAPEKSEPRQIAGLQADEKTSVAAPVVVENSMTAPVPVKTAVVAAIASPAVTEPALQIVEKIKPAAVVEVPPHAVEKAKLIPVHQPVVVEAIPQAVEKVESAPSVPVQTAAVVTEKPIVDTVTPPDPFIEKPLMASAQVKQPEKQVANKGKAPEPQVIPVAPPRNTTMAKPDSVPAAAVAAAPARKAKITPVQVAAPAPQMFAAHGAWVEVVNGTGGKGVANWWGNSLRQQGVPVAQFTTAGNNYAKTKIYYCEGYLQEAYQIAKKIPLYQEFVRVAAFEDSSAKIRVFIGRDVLRYTQKDAGQIILAKADPAKVNMALKSS